MATVVTGSLIHIQRTEIQESKIIDVSAWLAYEWIDGVKTAEPITLLNDPVTVTLPETEEGASVYSFDAAIRVRSDLIAGQIVKWEFVPNGVEIDPSETELIASLTWETAEYDVITTRRSTAHSVSVSTGINI